MFENVPNTYVLFVKTWSVAVSTSGSSDRNRVNVCSAHQDSGYNHVSGGWCVATSELPKFFIRFVTLRSLFWNVNPQTDGGGET